MTNQTPARDRLGAVGWRNVLDRLRAVRRPGGSYSDVILRLIEQRADNA